MLKCLPYHRMWLQMVLLLFFKLLTLIHGPHFQLQLGIHRPETAVSDGNSATPPTPLQKTLHHTGALYLSALVAEALAVKAALLAAVSSQVRSLTMYSDSKNLVSLLKNHGKDVTLQGVLFDIRLLALSLDSISFQFIPRLANVNADTLAKSAKSALLYFLVSAPFAE